MNLPKLIRDANVAVSPGIGFGQYGDDHVRFALIENEHRTRQALRNIKRLFRVESALIKLSKDRFLKPISVGLVGLGTVARGTLNVLANNREELARRIGREIQIAHVGARRDRDGVDLSGIQVSRELMDVANDPEMMSLSS